LSVAGTLALSGNYTVPSSLTVPTGAGTLSIGSTYTLTVGTNMTLLPGFSNSGTLSVNSGVTLTLNNSYSSGVLAGSGTISIGSTYTLTINASSTNSLSFAGAGTLSIASGITLTAGGNVTYSVPTVSGTGTLTIASGYTLTVGANSVFSISTVSGYGFLSISSGYTLTQGGNITVSVSRVIVSGTWANAGYGITIPSGSNVLWLIYGSFTTASTAGTLTVNGTCSYYGAGITAETSNAVPTFVLTLAGTGIFMGCPTSTQGTATTSIALSSTVIDVNAGFGTATGSGKIPYINLTSVTGSATGKYGLGVYDNSAATYAIFGLIYVGTASSAFSVSFYINYTTADTSGHTIEVWNASGSAGTITLTGTAYV